MKRVIPITIVCGLVLLIGLAYLCFSGKNIPDQADPKHEDSGYYARDIDGYVIIYQSDQETVFEYTSIPVGTLSQELQEELQEGKRLDNLGQVYGFLENYSS